MFILSIQFIIFLVYYIITNTTIRSGKKTENNGKNPSVQNEILD